ncbi:hypothetical protein [Actinomadura sp. WMMA1423]|uniref:hypothetical protein n=1 Tax=Actinomadura sp. WMMA1423 TaxID=2591108 RepID=UPI00114679B8|nr:hypothetical protein [Actinomadura sp. WMMA1423]
MGVARAKNWVPNRPVQDSRLAWEAAVPELRRRANPWWAVPLRILGAAVPMGPRHKHVPGGPTGYAREIGQEASGGRLKQFAIPVDVVSERLSPDERRLLRAEGELPDWFFDAVEEERRVRKNR